MRKNIKLKDKIFNHRSNNADHYDRAQKNTTQSPKVANRYKQRKKPTKRTSNDNRDNIKI